MKFPMDTREVKERVIPERRFTDVERASLDFMAVDDHPTELEALLKCFRSVPASVGSFGPEVSRPTCVIRKRRSNVHPHVI